MRLLPRVLWLTLGMLAASAGFAQVIQFESGGLTYQTLTRGGLTIMFAHMPIRIRDYGMIQVAASNGSSQVLKIRPQDFQFRLSDGRILRGVPAADVIGRFIRSASSSDVIKLVTTYEAGLYGMGRIRSTNGYEKRRQAALAVVSSKRLKAAAAASAIALVETELKPGESTDGAVFYPLRDRSTGEMTLVVTTAGRVFRFEPSRPQFER